MGEEILTSTRVTEVAALSSSAKKSQAAASTGLAAAGVAKSTPASGDAALVDLPRSAPTTLPAGQASEPLQSIFGAGVSAADIVSAHGGLDTARAFALLDDD